MKIKYLLFFLLSPLFFESALNHLTPRQPISDTRQHCEGAHVINHTQAIVVLSLLVFPDSLLLFVISHCTTGQTKITKHHTETAPKKIQSYETLVLLSKRIEILVPLHSFLCWCLNTRKYPLLTAQEYNAVVGTWLHFQTLLIVHH